MKIFLTLTLICFTSLAVAGLNYTKNGDIVGPGMFWAVLAREELADIKQNKGNSNKLMNNLQVSASYGFRPAMMAISAIYQNGDYGFAQDLPRAYAWWVLSMGNKVSDYTQNIGQFKATMTPEQNQQAEQLLQEFSRVYSTEATLKKFEKWYAESTAVTGSRLPGDHSYLNLQVQTRAGRTLTADQFYKQINKIYEDKLNELYQVIPGAIKTEDQPSTTDQSQQ